MAVITNLTGVNEVLGNLKKATKNLAQKTEDGLVIAGLFVKRISQEVVPIDTTNLKIGADVRKTGTGFDTLVRVLYVAAYAIFVHENLDVRHAPGKQAKFLEGPVRENMDRILKIIKDEATL